MHADPGFRRQLLECIPHLRAFAVSLTGNHALADDMVQETLLRCWAAQDSFEPGSNCEAWTFTVLRNAYYSHLRKRREQPDPEGMLAARIAAPARQEHALMLNTVQDALLALNLDQRESLLLVVAEGMTYEEAADIMGCSPGTVKSRVCRARDALAAMLHYGARQPAPRRVDARAIGRARRTMPSKTDARRQTN